ncbi:MAG: protein-disulfide reductase DsbD domain-containing protein [Limisphaerales bacterium]
MRTALSFLAALLLLPSVALRAAAPGGFFGPKTKTTLLIDHSTAKPGTTITAGVKLSMAKKWHTYWRNPGQNGKATGIKWTLPAGVSAGTIQWPVPHKTESWEMFSFEFSEEVILLVPLTIADSVAPGTISLKADLDWLECETEGACVPGSSSVETKLVIGSEAKLSPQADEMKKWAGYLPSSEPKIELTAYWEGPAKDDERNLVIAWKPTSKTNDFFSFRPSEDWVVEPPSTLISQADDKLVIRQKVTKYEGDWPKKIEGIIVDLEGNPKHPKAINVAAAIRDSKPKPTMAAQSFPSTFGSGLFGTENSGPKAVPSLSLHETVAPPGSTINALVKFRIASNWHIYWRNPGQFAGAPEFEFSKLPEGITVDPSSILWPIPDKKVKTDDTGGEIWNYELDELVGIIVPLQIGENVAKGTHDITIDLSWIECETASLCIKQEGSVSAQLAVGDEAVPSAAAGEIDGYITRGPKSIKGLDSEPTGSWESQVSSNQHAFVITWEGDAKSDFFSHEPAGEWTIDIPSEHVDAGAGKIGVRKVLKLKSGDLPEVIAGIWVTEKDGQRTAYEVSVPISGTSAPGTDETAAAAPQELNFFSALMFAFIGGLILNIMPCVLPVISLKILGFVNQSNDSPAEVKKLGMIYCLGVLASFLVMALLVIGVQKAGNIASWGMQFGNPVFLVCMLTLVTLVALNLFGVFEVMLGGGAMTAANSLASKHGPTGAFFNGVLATALATPCTAPFLAPALGFAFVQPPMIIILMFLTVGAGLAIPYLILSMNPKWLKFLPKPGNWMIGFKQAMGFPMLATAIWLLWTATDRFGQDGVLWLGFFLVLVSLSVWIWGEYVQRGTKRKGLAIAFSLLFLTAGVGYALEHKLQWRNPPLPVVANVQTNAQDQTGNALVWKPWSHEAIAAAQAEGRPVLVDFTAKWCATCNANKTFSIDIDATRDVLKELKYETLKADNTLTPENIVREIQSFGRAGVPLVLLYSPDANVKPTVMPASFTPSMIQDALKKAAGKK